MLSINESIFLIDIMVILLFTQALFFALETDRKNKGLNKYTHFTRTYKIKHKDQK